MATGDSGNACLRAARGAALAGGGTAHVVGGAGHKLLMAAYGEADLAIMHFGTRLWDSNPKPSPSPNPGPGPDPSPNPNPNPSPTGTSLWDSCAPGAWWALKDPRFTITLPIWLAAARRLRLKVDIVFVWREPAPNARSLDVHGHFEDSRRRWQAINSVALAEIVDEVCVQLAYTDLVSGAERRLDAITRLAQRLYAVKIPVAKRGRLQVNTSIADLTFVNKAEDNLDALTPSQANLAKRLRSSQCRI